jgi:type II secretory pathway pseudopilin PulG
MILHQNVPSPVQRRLVRAGLTLIELIVVMMILIALAGLLIPMLPSMLTRAHTSTCSTNMGETVRAITNYQALYSSYPNNWDALTDANGNLINYFANGAACPAQYLDAPTTGVAPNGNGEISILTLTPTEIQALTGTGITQIQAMTADGTPGTAPAGFDPTFTYYPDVLAGAANPTGNAIQVSGITKMAGLDPTNPNGAARIVALNLPLTGRYVCLGVGPRVGMVGKTIQTPPVHFGDQPVLNPEYGYQRMVAIFKVSDSAATAFTQAQLVGVGPVHDTGVGSIQDELQNWYQLTNNGS